MVLVSDTIWVFDPAGHPVTVAWDALAERLDVDPDVTYLQTYEPVAWDDTSLGCPEPGKDYSEVETPGFKLVFTPNPPKDTDGRREGSGRGWVRELQGRWPGLLG